MKNALNKRKIVRVIFAGEAHDWLSPDFFQWNSFEAGQRMCSSERHRQRVTAQDFKFDALDLQICGSRRNRQFQRAVLKSLSQFALRSIVEQDVDPRKRLLKRGQRWRQYFNRGRR